MINKVSITVGEVVYFRTFLPLSAKINKPVLVSFTANMYQLIYQLYQYSQNSTDTPTLVSIQDVAILVVNSCLQACLFPKSLVQYHTV